MEQVYRSTQRGFSTIELLLSLGIIMLIMSFVVPGLSRVFKKSGAASTKNTLRVVNQAVLDYKMDTQMYPEKLQDLIKRPENVQGWSGPYVAETMFKDGEILDYWQQALVYKKGERGSKKAYELYSLGDDTKEEEEKIEA